MNGVRVFQLSRVGSLDPNPTTLNQKASGAMAQVRDGTTFVTVRLADGLQHLVVVPDSATAEAEAFSFAQAVSAQVREVEAPDLGVPACAFLVFDKHSVWGVATQAGADLQVVPGAIAQSLSVAGSRWRR